MFLVHKKFMFAEKKEINFGKALAKIKTQIQKRKRLKKNYSFIFKNGFVEKNTWLSNYKKQNLFFRLPAFFKNFKDLDSTELKKNDNRDSNQVLKENQKIIKKGLMSAFLFYVSRPQDELYFCKTYSENSRFNNESLSVVLKRPRFFRQRHFYKFENQNYFLEFEHQNLKMPHKKSDNDFDDNLMEKMWTEFHSEQNLTVNDFVEEIKSVFIFSKDVINGTILTEVDDVFVGKRELVVKKPFIKDAEIRSFLNVSSMAMIATAARKPRRYQKSKLLIAPVPKPELLSLQFPRNALIQRVLKIRREMPRLFSAVQNFSPFGPAINYKGFGKVIFNIHVHPIELYTIAKVVTRFAFFGTYYNALQINGQLKRALGCYINWEFIRNFYNLLKIPQFQIINKTQLYKIFRNRFLQRIPNNFILKNEKFFLDRKSLEKFLLPFFFPNGILYQIRLDLLNYRIFNKSKPQKLDFIAAKNEILNISIDPFFWCSVVGKKNSNNVVELAETNFEDFFDNNSFLIMENRAKQLQNSTKNLETFYIQKLKSKQIPFLQKLEKIQGLKSNPKFFRKNKDLNLVKIDEINLDFDTKMKNDEIIDVNGNLPKMEDFISLLKPKMSRTCDLNSFFSSDDENSSIFPKLFSNYSEKRAMKRNENDFRKMPTKKLKTTEKQIKKSDQSACSTQ